MIFTQISYNNTPWGKVLLYASFFDPAVHSMDPLRGYVCVPLTYYDLGTDYSLGGSSKLDA